MSAATAEQLQAFVAHKARSFGKRLEPEGCKYCKERNHLTGYTTIAEHRENCPKWWQDVTKDRSEEEQTAKGIRIDVEREDIFEKIEAKWSKLKDKRGPSQERVPPTPPKSSRVPTPNASSGAGDQKMPTIQEEPADALDSEKGKSKGSTEQNTTDFSHLPTPPPVVRVQQEEKGKSKGKGKKNDSDVEVSYGKGQGRWQGNGWNVRRENQQPYDRSSSSWHHNRGW